MWLDEFVNILEITYSRSLDYCPRYATG